MKSLRVIALMLPAAVAAGSTGCPVWRTEHKVETTHKIEAHIVLDIRKVQEEAAAVEGEVREPLATPKAQSDGKPQSMLNTGWPERPARSIWSVFDTARGAYAQDSKEEDAAKDRRKARIRDIDAALTGGCLGENNKGYLEARPCGAKDDEKAALKNLAKEENADRKIIYAGIAVRQGLPADKADAIGEVFAGEIRSKLKKGQAFQVPSSDQLFGEFKNSKEGKALPDAKKGEWVAAP